MRWICHSFSENTCATSRSSRSCIHSAVSECSHLTHCGGWWVTCSPHTAAACSKLLLQVHRAELCDFNITCPNELYNREGLHERRDPETARKTENAHRCEEPSQFQVHSLEIVSLARSVSESEATQPSLDLTPILLYQQYSGLNVPNLISH